MSPYMYQLDIMNGILKLVGSGMNDEEWGNLFNLSLGFFMEVEIPEEEKMPLKDGLIKMIAGKHASYVIRLALAGLIRYIETGNEEIGELAPRVITTECP